MKLIVATYKEYGCPPLFFIGHMVWVSTSYTTHESYDLSYQEEEDGDDKKVPSVGTLGQLSFVTSSRGGRERFCHKQEWERQAAVGERGVLCKKLGKPILCKETDRVWICQPLMYKTHMDQLTRMVKMTMSVITEDQYFNFELS